MNNAEPSTRRQSRSPLRQLLFGKDWRLGWMLLLLMHTGGCLAWAWLMPRGFPLSHLRFWANSLLPLVAALVLLSGVVAAGLGWQRWFLAVTLGVALAWTAASVTGAILFPSSAKKFLLPAIAVSLLMWIAWVSAQRGRAKSWLVCVAVGCCALLGTMVFIYSQRSPDAATRPLNVAMPDEPAPGISVPEFSLPLSEEVTLGLWDGSLQVRCRPLSLDVLPMLKFESRSPDRCWTSLARREDRVGRPIERKAIRQKAGTWGLSFAGDEKLVLLVKAPDDGKTLVAGESYAELAEPVYSHLNSFLELNVRGHQKLSLSFSPCPEARIEVLPADYPVGRPARMAYLDSAGMFRVVEATSGEKGPFRLLAEGPLKRGEPLTITFHDAGHPVCDLTLEDWTAQVSTQLSPTAGWGLPEGAIEFRLLDDAATSNAGLWVTLAATSVGRGWDSVGHQEGTYRNKFRIVRHALSASDSE